LDSRLKHVVVVVVANQGQRGAVLDALKGAGYIAVGVGDAPDARTLFLSGFRPACAFIHLKSPMTSVEMAREVAQNLPGTAIILVAPQWASDADAGWTVMPLGSSAVDVVTAIDHRLGACVVHLLALARWPA
jgi:hypothetical protein